MIKCTRTVKVNLPRDSLASGQHWLMSFNSVKPLTRMHDPLLERSCHNLANKNAHIDQCKCKISGSTVDVSPVDKFELDPFSSVPPLWLELQLGWHPVTSPPGQVEADVSKLFSFIRNFHWQELKLQVPDNGKITRLIEKLFGLDRCICPGLGKGLAAADWEGLSRCRNWLKGCSIWTARLAHTALVYWAFHSVLCLTTVSCSSWEWIISPNARLAAQKDSIGSILARLYCQILWMTELQSRMNMDK